MGIWASAGGSDSHDSFRAGVAAATEALAGREDADLILVFGTAGHDQDALLAGVRSVTGETPLGGCSAEGVIGPSMSSEGSHVIRTLVIGGGLRATTHVARDVGGDTQRAAKSIAAAFAGEEPDLVLLFPDGLTINSTQLLVELHALMPRTLFVGGAAGDMMQFLRTYQYIDGTVVSDGVAAVGISGALDVRVAVTHGCDPLGIEHVITRAEGAFVHEIDGQPAWEVMRSYLEGPAEDLTAVAAPFLCLASRAPGNDDDLIIRVPLGLQKETGTLFFPGELREGETVMMARRHGELIAKRAVKAAHSILAEDRRRPAFVLQFDCTGRGRILYGDRVTDELIEPVQKVFGDDVPWLGFHCYGEIAPVGRVPYYHNYTMALCAIFDAKTDDD